MADETAVNEDRVEVDDFVRFVDVAWEGGEEPEFDEDDGEALVDEPVDVLAFAVEVADLDLGSYERWVQSCLKSLVAPTLQVDGVLGLRTRQAVRAFQRQIGALRPGARALVVDGVLGPATLAALELCTDSTRPTITEAQRKAAAAPAAPSPATPPEPAPEPFTVTTTRDPRGALHTVSAHGDRVSFRYRTEERKDAAGKTLRDPYNVSSYEGARRDLLTDEELQRFGFSPSELKILRENAFKESRGAFGAVNTWDDQIVSWGMAQFAGHAGSLASLLLFLKEEEPAAFARWFGAVGVDVAHGPYPYYDRKTARDTTRTGPHVVITAAGETYAGDRGWAYLRTQPRLIGALMLAGNDPAVQRVQCRFWKAMFLDRAVATRIGKARTFQVVRVDGGGGTRRETTLLPPSSESAFRAWSARNPVGGRDLAALFDGARGDRLAHATEDGARLLVTAETAPGYPLHTYCTSEYSLGVMARLYNWMPAYVRAWSADFLGELAAARPGVDVLDPGVWERDPALEVDFVERVKTRRRTVKRGSYDAPYGDSLSRARGSFVAGAAALDPAEPPAEPPADVSAEPAPGPTAPAAGDRPDVDVTARSPVDKRKRVRAWTDLRGITLHQTGVHGFGAGAWPRVTAHLGVHSDGRVFHIHPLDAYLWSSDALNRDTVAIEVAGNFLGDLARPDSYWKQGKGPSELTPAMIDGLRRAIRFIVAEVARHGGRITDIYAHRQAKRGKSNCPGAAIWQRAGVWAQVELGLGNGGPGYTRDDGLPIPPAWDPRLLDQPLPFLDPEDYSIDIDDMRAEDGAEFPDAREAVYADPEAVVVTGARVLRIPAGARLVEGPHVDPDMPLRTSLLAGPIDLDPPAEDLLARALDDALQRQGLVQVDVLRLEPSDPAGEPVRALDLDDALDFEITIEEDERAVVLLEEDGVYRWVFAQPDSAPEEATRSGAARTARFSIARETDDDGVVAPTRGLLGALARGSLTARVYKFFAGHLVRLGLARAIDHLEGEQREGPVLIRGTELRDWIDRDDLDGVELPRDRPARVLLLIHGTFSSTRGSFGGLCEGSGREVLARALSTYDLVLGVDHRTLGRLPADNAAAIADLLARRSWPVAPRIDVVGFSRGGLVARELIERRLPAVGLAGRVERVVCVATTNAGTELARPANWRDLVDTYTTLAGGVLKALGLGTGAGALAGIVGGEIVTAVGALVKALATHAIEDGAVPGLSAMDPDGEVVRALDGAALMIGERPRYFAVTSCFDADAPDASGGLSARARAVLADRVTRRLYRGAASDLVVHNASTQRLHRELRYDDVLHFERNASVYHVNFFLQPALHARLVDWLELAPARPLPATGDDLPEIVVEDEGPLAFVDEPEDLVDLHLRAEAPARVGLEEVFAVQVELAREALDEALGEHTARASALVDAGELVALEVVPRAGVAVLSPAPTLVAVPAPGAVVGVFFRLRAEALGDGELWVLARQGGRPLARLALRVRVVSGRGVAPEVTGEAAALDPAACGTADAPTLEVLELREAGGLRYRYLLRAPALGLGHRFESAPLPVAPDDHVRGLYDRIERDWKQSAGEPQRFDRRLRALGVQLGEQLFPRDLAAALWEHRERLRGLQLLSDEAAIPWELVHLKHPGRPLAAGEAGFLGELGLVRALWGAVPAPRIDLREGRAFTVVPEYPSALALPSAVSEQTWLEGHLSTSPLASDPDAVLARLAEPGSFDLLHVACHGEIADQDAWLLLQGEVREVREGGVARRKWFPGRLAASEVAAAADLRGPGGRRPLVFLNACKVARSEHLLTGFAGWAPALLRAGAGAVVAPLWSVGDGSALRFAEGFYGALLQGAGFSAAAIAGRAHARRLGDPTALAYAVFAAPGGRLRRATP